MYEELKVELSYCRWKIVLAILICFLFLRQILFGCNTQKIYSSKLSLKLKIHTTENDTNVI